MAFMLPALGGLLGSMLFKQDGGRVSVPELQSKALSSMSGKPRMVSQPVLKSFPKMKKGGVVCKMKGGKIKK